MKYHKTVLYIFVFLTRIETINTRFTFFLVKMRNLLQDFFYVVALNIFTIFFKKGA